MKLFILIHYCLQPETAHYAKECNTDNARMFGLLLVLHALAEDLDLPLDLHPQDKLVQTLIVSCSVNDTEPVVLQLLRQSLDIINLPVFLLLRDGQKSSDEGLLNVRKAELVGNLGNGSAELVGELNLLVALELLLPEFAVCSALLEVGVGEVVLSVEARGAFLDSVSHWLAPSQQYWRTYRDTRVQTVQVVCAPDDQDTVVRLEPIHLVQEVAPHIV